MKLKALLCLLFLSILLASPVQAAPEEPSDWWPVDLGVEYQEFYLQTAEGPIRAYVARMDRNNPAVTLESGIAKGKIIWKYEEGLSTNLEPVSQIAARYNQALNYWGEHWGGRNRVAVAINGSYYNGLTGEIIQGMVHSGWYAARFWDGENNSGFAWRFDRSAFIGGCVYHPEDKQVVVFQDGNTMVIDDLNVPREDDQLILYTPQWNSNTSTPLEKFDVEVVVEMAQPAMLLPSQEMARGTVREIRKNQGSTYIQFDQVVLSAQGEARDRLLNNVEIGDQIEIYQRIRNCDYEPDQPDWSKTYASVGMGFHFLKQGQVIRFPDNAGALQRHPRTAIVFNDASMYFIVVDGRSELSIGMTIDELAYFSKDTLGAIEGVSLDGGGSSTMVVNGVVRNVPSDPCTTSLEEPQWDGSNDYRQALLEIESVEGGINSIQGCERYVANSMMMVVVEPMLRSTTFTPGNPVRTHYATEMRLGPGSNYAAFASIPAGSEGLIVEHSNDMNGVLAKGEYWWRVDFSGSVGWVSELPLTTDPTPTPVPTPTPEPGPQNLTFLTFIQR